MNQKTLCFLLTVLMGICIVPCYMKNGLFGASLAIVAMVVNAINYFNQED